MKRQPTWHPELAELVQTPSRKWIWGAGLFLLFSLGLLAIFFWQLEVPNTVDGRVKVVSDSPSISVRASANGILNILVTENTLVDEAERIGWITDSVKLETVLALKATLANFEGKIPRMSGQDFDLAKDDLGILNVNYAALREGLSSFKRFKGQTQKNKKKQKALKKEITILQNRLLKVSKEVGRLEKLYQKDFDLYNEEYIELYETGTISKNELLLQEAKMNQRLIDLQVEQEKLDAIKREILTLQQSFSGANVLQAEETRTSEADLTVAYNRLLKDISDWEDKYVLTTPVKGKLSYMRLLKQGAKVVEGQELIAIMPENGAGGVVAAKMFLPKLQAEKITVGQEVHLSWDDYGTPDNAIPNMIATVGTLTKMTITDWYEIVLNLTDKNKQTLYNLRETRPTIEGEASVFIK